MRATLSAGLFENGVGPVDSVRRASRNQFAMALFDAEGRPLAVAGAYLKYGAFEIGVDVIREYRGRGLGRLVVAALTSEIMERDGVPLYLCAATNIRSQRTALSSGFLPVMSDAFVG